ncbi:MAG: GMC family oxidoreductase [Acidimicrobiales bacterium]
MTGYDVAVVGSGFGGGPAALRAAEAGASVVVLERGKRYDRRPGSVEFRQTQTDLQYLLDLWGLDAGFDWDTNRASIVLGGRGLGGGSLIYSMVSLRAPSFVFDDPVWPEAVTRAALDPFYERAERQLGVVQLQWDGDRAADDWKLTSKRDTAFAVACAQAGVSCDPVPVAVNKECGNLGWCSTGCVRHGKASVDLQYLGPAEDLGAVLRTGVQVTLLQPAPASSGRRWQLTLHTSAGAPAEEVYADSVVVAAGAVGSPTLLLRSAGRLPGGISDQTGRNLSRGGDLVIPVVLPDDLDLGAAGDASALEMLPGKIIGSCSFEYLFEPPPGFGPDWQRFIMQPMMFLPIVSSLLVADPDGITPEGGDMRSFGAGHKRLMEKWGSRLLHIGIMGVDGMDGRVGIDDYGATTVGFGNSAATRNLFDGARAAARHIFEGELGGRVLPTWDQLRGDVLAIHPLGTCRMADGPDLGVIDDRCRVYRRDGTVHDGLYVMDASTYSSPIAVNTSLTAAAIAERAMSLML